MIPPEILNRKSLFSLLHKIDFEIAEQARARGCPIVGGPLHYANYPRKPRGGPPDLDEAFEIRYSLCCGREGCRRRVLPPSVRFLAAPGILGRRSFLSPPPFGKDEIRTSPWNSSKAFSVYGVPPSTDGNIIFESSFPRALLTDVWPDT